MARPAAPTKSKATAKKAGAKAPAKAGSKRARAPSVSESDSGIDSSESSGDDDDDDDDDEDAGDQQAAMLAALEAHGRAIFGLGGGGESSKQGARAAKKSAAEDEKEDDDEEDAEDESDDEGFHTDDGWGAGDGFVTDSEDELAAPVPSKPKAPAVPEVVFAEAPKTSSFMLSKSEKRAFLSGNSAKMMGLKTETVPQGRERKRAREDDEEEQSNLRLDKTLHDMLLTSLLPTAAADSAARPVEKRNALSGRLLELAGHSRAGEGANVVRGASMPRHPAKVRTGLVHAQQRRAEKARAEAEAAGSWVKGVGGLGDMGKGSGAGLRPADARRKAETRTFGEEVGKKKGMSGKKAERSKGLGMGVGRFERGTLTISEREIARVNNIGKGGSGGKKKKGGKKGGW